MPQTTGMQSRGSVRVLPRESLRWYRVTIRGSQFFHVSSSSIWVGDGYHVHLSPYLSN